MVASCHKRLALGRLCCFRLCGQAAFETVGSAVVDSRVCRIFCWMGILVSMKKYGKWIATAIVLLVALAVFIVQKIALPYGEDGTLIFDDPSQSYIKVHVLDVGQADAVIVELPGHRAMMIDAGTINQADKIKAYIEKLSVKTLDFVVGTHPHDDHVGSLHKVLEFVSVGELYMPDINNEYTDKIRLAAQEHGVPIKSAKAGVVIWDDGDLRIEILAPNRSEYDDVNDYSAVVKITYINNTFLFTGDATALSEKEMVVFGADLDADVLKIAHHGADTSSCQGFLDAVSPEYAVISVGEDNSYGLPDADVRERLDQANIKVYRTDLEGTIVFFGNGQRIGVQTEK